MKAQNADSVGIAFEEAATKTRAVYDKYYLIAYCSPARNGLRRLKVEVAYRDVKGNEKHGSFSQDFDASGFGPGCNPESVPRFVPQVTRQAGRAVSRRRLAAGERLEERQERQVRQERERDDTSHRPAEDDGSSGRAAARQAGLLALERTNDGHERSRPLPRLSLSSSRSSTRSGSSSAGRLR